jgi:putative DNA primase/helicase
MSDTIIRPVPLHELPEQSRLVVKCAANIKPEKIDWLWEQRLPLGKCVLVAGEGGLGKSMVLAWIAATVSRGKGWPCGEGQSQRGSVIILSAEDDAADTIVPRLIAADADCSKVHILEAVRKDDEGHRSFNLQLDLPELEKTIEQLDDVLLVIIDPIASYLGKVDSHKNADIRSVLEPLGKMAAKRHVTVIANTHLSKATGGSANSRVIGSVAFVNHARAAFIVTADPEDNGRRLFLPSKTNLGKPRDGLAYRIADAALPGSDHGSLIWAPYVTWESAPVAISADQAMAALAGNSDGRRAIEEAKQFLLEVLSEGQEGQKEIKRQAEEAGFHWRTVRRAKDLLGVEAIREGGLGEKGRWIWRLAKKPKVSTSEFGHLSHLSQLEPPKVPKVSNVKPGHLREGFLDADAEERAAILEYDAGLSRAEAEARASEEMPDLPEFLDRRSAR